MDVNGSSTSVGNEDVVSCVAKFVNILLVDRDTTSLMSLASQFEHQFYKVITSESARVALSLFQERNNYFDIVIADIDMKGIGIFEFVEKLHDQCMIIPIILMAKDLTTNLASEALAKGVCYFFSKPPSHRDISTIWHHIPRVTGHMPSWSDKTNHIYIERDYNPSSGTDKKNMIRKKDQIAETSNSVNEFGKEDAHGSKKPRFNWTPHRHVKFLRALNILGDGAKPRTILRIMNEPNMTARHVNSHFQKYRKQKMLSVNVEKMATPLMPAVFPSAPVSTVMEGQTYNTATSNTTAAPNSTATPNSVQVQNHDAFNHSRNNIVNTIINNDGFGNDDSHVEGTYNGSNQKFEEMPSDDDINRFIEELNTPGANIWDD